MHFHSATNLDILPSVIATFVNCAAVIIGSIIGLFLRNKIGDVFKKVVYAGIGCFTLFIGIKMALETQRILYLALAIVVGGLLGTWWGVEKGVLRLGSFLQGRFAGKSGDGASFAYGFLNASVLFCVGAMTLVGSFKAGAQGNYDLIFTKSVMDGFMAILLTAAMGIGVAFSALAILVYQGGLTLLAAALSPLVTPLILSEVSGTGGVLVMMIGFNLLDLKEIKTADFLPALLIIILLSALEPVIGGLLGIG